MNKNGYQVLGFLVWNGSKLYIRRRYGDTPRKLAIGGMLVTAIAVLAFAGRKASSD
jgi:hypothetical protein